MKGSPLLRVELRLLGIYILLGIVVSVGIIFSKYICQP